MSRLVVSTYRNGAHRYSLDGEWCPGVTSCTGILEKRGLYYWYGEHAASWVLDNPDQLDTLGREEYVKTARGAADRVKKAAGQAGRDLHAHAEKLVTTGEAPDVPAADLPLVIQAADFLDAMAPEVLASERAVFNDVFRYAGRLDLLAVIRGDVWLLDFKTGVGIYPEHALQQSAYRFATHMQSTTGDQDEAMPAIARVGAVHVRPDGWQVVPLNADRDTWRAFLAAIDVYRFTRREKDEVVMAPIAAGRADDDQEES
jgi:hypothetical protein